MNQSFFNEDNYNVNKISYLNTCQKGKKEKKFGRRKRDILRIDKFFQHFNKFHF